MHIVKWNNTRGIEGKARSYICPFIGKVGEPITSMFLEKEPRF
jgi:hypothetical protein